MSDASAIQAAVKQYILSEFLQGEDSAALTGDTPLISGGIMDSLSNMQLVTYIEENFDVTIGAHEISPDHMDTLELIAQLIASKQS